MEALLKDALGSDGQNDAKKRAASYGLEVATILNDKAVPPLSARLSAENPMSEASKLALRTLAKMQTVAANQASLSWAQNANTGAAKAIFALASNTQKPEIWQASLSSMFLSEDNRQAIRSGLAARAAGRTER